MKKWIVVGAFLTASWLFIRGVTLESFLGELLIGLGIGFIIAYLLRNMYPGEINMRHWVSVAPHIGEYLWIFVRELLTANMDVARKMLLPGETIEPDIIEVNLRTENPVAISILANSITLTPGTLTMDHKEGKNVLYVHSISGKKDREEFINTVRDWEDLLLKIFTDQTGNATRNER